MQKILFGSPGTGKSYKIDHEIVPDTLGITNKDHIVKTVFHPEYTYGDFMGKLLPMTRANNVEYRFYEGHFLRTLAKAYKSIIESKKQDSQQETATNVVLVIDEINRGNSSAIFGTIFQLLDRDEKEWSSYPVSISELEQMKLLELTCEEILYDNKGVTTGYKLPTSKHALKDLNALQNETNKQYS
ncbi:MAG: AAA family ATPase [Candidatus Desantisbacteria bacterium]